MNTKGLKGAGLICMGAWVVGSSRQEGYKVQDLQFGHDLISGLNAFIFNLAPGQRN